jgi:hypothetical protein
MKIITQYEQIDSRGTSYVQEITHDNVWDAQRFNLDVEEGRRVARNESNAIWHLKGKILSQTWDCR